MPAITLADGHRYSPVQVATEEGRAVRFATAQDLTGLTVRWEMVNRVTGARVALADAAVVSAGPDGSEFDVALDTADTSVAGPHLLRLTVADGAGVAALPGGLVEVEVSGPNRTLTLAYFAQQLSGAVQAEERAARAALAAETAQRGATGAKEQAAAAAAQAREDAGAVLVAGRAVERVALDASDAADRASKLLALVGALGPVAPGHLYTEVGRRPGGTAAERSIRDGLAFFSTFRLELDDGPNKLAVQIDPGAQFDGGGFSAPGVAYPVRVSAAELARGGVDLSGARTFAARFEASAAGGDPHVVQMGTSGAIMVRLRAGGAVDVYAQGARFQFPNDTWAFTTGPTPLVVRVVREGAEFVATLRIGGQDKGTLRLPAPAAQPVAAPLSFGVVMAWHPGDRVADCGAWGRALSDDECAYYETHPGRLPVAEPVPPADTVGAYYPNPTSVQLVRSSGTAWVDVGPQITLTGDGGGGGGAGVVGVTAGGIPAALAKLAGRPGTVRLTSATVLAEPVTAPADVHLEIDGAGEVAFVAGGSLRIDGTFSAPVRRVFVGAVVAPVDTQWGAKGPHGSRVTFGAVRQVVPEWWGASPGGEAESAPAIMAAVHSRMPARTGPQVMLSPGVYRCGMPVQAKVTMYLEGVNEMRDGGVGTELWFPDGTEGVVIHRASTIGSPVETAPAGSPAGVYTAGDGSYLGMLQIRGSWNAQGRVVGALAGVRSRARLVARGVRVANVFGDGWAIEGSSSTGSVIDGNANLFSLDGCSADRCAGSGLYIDGYDANAGEVKGFNTKRNLLWGIHDSGFHANVILGGHTATNGLLAQCFHRPSEWDVEGHPRFNDAPGPTGIKPGHIWFLGPEIVPSTGDVVSQRAQVAQIAADTEPGTNPFVWRQGQAMKDPGGEYLPQWDPSVTFVPGGSTICDSLNGSHTVIGLYSEGGQPPTKLNNRGLWFGGVPGAGFWDNRGIVIVDGQLRTPMTLDQGDAEVTLGDPYGELPQVLFNVKSKLTESGGSRGLDLVANVAQNRYDWFHRKGRTSHYVTALGNPHGPGQFGAPNGVMFFGDVVIDAGTVPPPEYDPADPSTRPRGAGSVRWNRNALPDADGWVLSYWQRTASGSWLPCYVRTSLPAPGGPTPS